MVDVSMTVYLVLVVMVEWENAEIVLVALLLQDVEVHHCVEKDVMLVVEAMLLHVLNPMMMYSMIDVKGHGIYEEVAAMVIKRFPLSLMFN